LYNLPIIIVAYKIYPFIVHALNATKRPSYAATVLINTCPAIADDINLHLRSALTQCKLFFKYMLLWICPLPTSIDMREPFAKSANQITGLILFAGFYISSIVLMLRKTTKYLGLGMFITASAFLPELSRTRTGEIFVLYRTYIYSVGYAIIFAWFVNRINRYWITLLLIIIVFASITYIRLDQFNSQEKAWHQAVRIINLDDPRVSCQAPRALNSYGKGLLLEGKIIEAIPQLEKAIKIFPEYWSPLNNLAEINYLLGNYSNARYYWEKIIKNGRSPYVIGLAKKGLEKLMQKNPHPEG